MAPPAEPTYLLIVSIPCPCKNIEPADHDPQLKELQKMQEMIQWMTDMCNKMSVWLGYECVWASSWASGTIKIFWRMKIFSSQIVALSVKWRPTRGTKKLRD
jgi:hypothetical protein